MKACFHAGADAVYMGLPRFSARAYAENAGLDTYLEAIDFAHLRGKNLYCTVNTLFKEKELFSELFELLKPLYERGLDAVIVQDTGAMSYIRACFPDLPVFASTQCTVTSAGSVRELKKLGVSRFILARELSLSEIKRIKEETGEELECFIHGALCYCYSGQCLFSSIAGERSGNRGRCAQPCRMAYSVRNEEGKLLASDLRMLSLKDLNTLDFLPEIIEAGATSLKIEGRMKKAEYAAGVTAVYRKYLDIYEKRGKQAYKVDPKDQKALFDLFNRQGFTEGYFKKHNGKDMMAFKENEFREENKALYEGIRKAYIEKELKTRISGELTIKQEEPLRIRLRCTLNGVNYDITEVSDFIPEAAANRSASIEEVRKQLVKTGDTPFVFTDLDIELDEGLFLPVKALNEFRRSALAALEERILEHFKRDNSRSFEDCRRNEVSITGQSANETAISGKDTNNPEAFFLSAQVRTREQLEEALKAPGIHRIILSSAGFPVSAWKESVNSIHSIEKQAFLAFPRIFREKARAYFEKAEKALQEAGFDGFLLPNLDALDFLKALGIQGRFVSDHSLYAFNSLSRSFLKSAGFNELTVPLELNHYEMEETGFAGDSLVIYGRLPMMVTANCIHKNTEKCDGKPRELVLIDRNKNRLPVINDCRFCENTILNRDPLVLLTDRENIGKLNLREGRLDFTLEDREETAAVLKAYTEVFLEDQKASAEEALGLKHFTRGHFRRGVE